MYQFIGKIPHKSAYLCIWGNAWLFSIFYMWHIHKDHSIITQKRGYLYLYNHVGWKYWYLFHKYSVRKVHANQNTSVFAWIQGCCATYIWLTHKYHPNITQKWEYLHLYDHGVHNSIISWVKTFTQINVSDNNNDFTQMHLNTDLHEILLMISV